MSNKTKKKRFSFNVLDVFIILLVVILIASIAYKISQNMDKDANKDNPIYTVAFECEEYESLAKYLSNGEAVYITSSGELLGYIYKSADVQGSSAIVVIKDEEVTTEDVPADAESADDLYERVRFEGKLKLNGNTKKSVEGNYYTLEGLNIAVGSKIEVYTDDAEFTITVKQFIDKDGE